MIDKKPSIITVIRERVVLRRSGQEMAGQCPFHSDTTPSFSVNAEKGLFHCFGCGESGDVFDFIMKIDGLSFPEACKALGMENPSDRRPAPMLTAKRKTAAELAIAWVADQRAKFNVLIADALERRDIADEIAAFELAETINGELTMYRGFYDSLSYPTGAAEMLALRPAIEAITDGIGMEL